jgi:hypothetical protein
MTIINTNSQVSIKIGRNYVITSETDDTITVNITVNYRTFSWTGNLLRFNIYIQTTDSSNNVINMVDVVELDTKNPPYNAVFTFTGVEIPKADMASAKIQFYIKTSNNPNIYRYFRSLLLF